MRIFYSTLLYLLAPLVIAKLLFNSLRNPAYRKRIGERLGRIRFTGNEQPLVWLHAVSVGEVQAARPLIDRLLQQQPGQRLVITTITPTGAALVQQLFADAVEHFYLPYDMPHAIRRFISALNPRLLIIMETEIWPNLLYYCQRQGTKTVLVNARLSDRSYFAYRRVAGFIGDTLQRFDLLCAQTQSDADRLLALGADPAVVYVSGNIKFDVAISDDTLARGQALRRSLAPDRPVFIAASTHQGEEAIIFSACKAILQQVPDCLLILVPRHPHRVGAIRELAASLDLSVVSGSAAHSRGTDSQVFLVDSLGELAVFYACSDIAFVGGSLVAVGGHNVLEPAAAGLPVISGRHTANFDEIVQGMRRDEAIVLVNDAAQLAARVLDWLGDADKRHDYGERGRRFVLKNQGSVNRVLERLQKFGISQGQGLVNLAVSVTIVAVNLLEKCYVT
ncbi:MAG: lipid IV(A) 3-deoxy-D-manno-octulosonic acid transferase [Gammaproteobacteria bacterium]